jgi:hypothetical protein
MIRGVRLPLETRGIDHEPMAHVVEVGKLWRETFQ